MSETTNGMNGQQNPVTGTNPAATAPEGAAPGGKEKLGTRLKKWLKRNKPALIGGAIGLGTGVAGTIGVGEIGKRSAERKARQQYTAQEQNHSPLDPNY